MVDHELAPVHPLSGYEGSYVAVAGDPSRGAVHVVENVAALGKFLEAKIRAFPEQHLLHLACPAARVPTWLWPGNSPMAQCMSLRTWTL